MDWEVRGNATGYNMNGAEAPTTLRVQAGRKDHRQFADYQRLVPLRCCRQAPTRDGWLHIKSIAAESVNSVSSNVVPKLIEGNGNPRQSRKSDATNGALWPRSSRGKSSEVYPVLFGVLLCQPCHGLRLRPGDVVDGLRGVAEQPREVITDECVCVV